MLNGKSSDEVTKIYALGQQLLDAVRESGLLRAKRRTARKRRARKPRVAAPVAKAAAKAAKAGRSQNPLANVPD